MNGRKSHNKKDEKNDLLSADWKALKSYQLDYKKCLDTTEEERSESP